MGTIKTTGEVSNSIETSQFELHLPDVLNIKPWVNVPMPRNKIALIYEVNRSNNDEEKTHLEYNVYIVNAKTLRSTRDPYNMGRPMSFTDLPALKHYLYDVVGQLSVKKRSRKVVDVVDLQDDDDE
jgi:hypothetical protein